MLRYPKLSKTLMKQNIKALHTIRLLIEKLQKKSTPNQGNINFGWNIGSTNITLNTSKYELL